MNVTLSIPLYIPQISNNLLKYSNTSPFGSNGDINITSTLGSLNTFNLSN